MESNESTPSEMSARVSVLEQQADIDQAIIEALEAEGIIDRAKIADLETALVTCRQIGASIGIIMAGQKITEGQAFRLLRAESQRLNRKLRDVASDVLLTGALGR
jgi:hypothetical protein